MSTFPDLSWQWFEAHLIDAARRQGVKASPKLVHVKGVGGTDYYTDARAPLNLTEIAREFNVIFERLFANEKFR